MASFPTLSTGQTCFYPVTQARRQPVEVLQFCNDTEQRFVVGPMLNGWALQFSNVTAADRILIQDFFDSVKGSFDATWDLLFDGVTYASLYFAEDSIEWQEARLKRWSTSVRVKQAK